jgi:DNA-binding SARP family transcriptional activator
LGEAKLQFKILGPLEVVSQDRVVPLGGIKQRAMLGMLLLRANRIVPSSKLLNSLWDGRIPPTARKMLQNAASALRRPCCSPTHPDTCCASNLAASI